MIRLTAVLCLMMLSAWTGGDKPVGLRVGAKAPDFELSGLDGKRAKLSDVAGKGGVVVVFTSNHCPFSIQYEDRLIALHQRFAPSGYPIVAINPNDALRQPDDALANMQKRAEAKHLPYPYLQDKAQAVAKSFGATRTPEIFVLRRDGNDYILVYKGALDDNPNSTARVRSRYVEQAITKLLAGQRPTTPTTTAIGCAIKWREN